MIVRRLFPLGAASLLFVLCSTAAAQDFQKTYHLSAGSTVAVHNISGDVHVTGYEGNTILVSAFKEGRDRDLVEVEDLSSSSRVDFRARYPKNCDCNASIRFQVRVPHSVNYKFDSLSSVSGNVEVIGVTGELEASSTSGDVLVKEATGSVHVSTVSGRVEVQKVAGTVNANSISGNVEAEITRLEGAGKMKFKTVSGNVTVKLPSNLDADIEMSSLSGSLHTDFPIQIKEHRFGPGTSARGRVGNNGSYGLQLSSTSGNVSLKRL